MASAAVMSPCAEAKVACTIALVPDMEAASADTPGKAADTRTPARTLGPSSSVRYGDVTETRYHLPNSGGRMSINTNLKGRLRNHKLPASQGLLPLFEAIANSIHAIEDANRSPTAGRISIAIERENQLVMIVGDDDRRRGAPALLNILNFKVTDNGVGFTDQNMQSFATLDSEYKSSRGGRGVGRLMWLKAFRSALVVSNYTDTDGTWKERSLSFTRDEGIFDVRVTTSTARSSGTTVTLVGFEEDYRESVPKGHDAIAQALLEHCLWYFVRPGGSPTIVLTDGNESVDLTTLYEGYMLQGSATDTFTVKGRIFEVLHVRLHPGAGRNHSISYCAGGRLVLQHPAKNVVQGLVTQLSIDGQPFVYQCYVTSDFLDDRVHADRLEFNITADPASLRADDDIGWNEIEGEVGRMAATFLASSIAEAKVLGEHRLRTFIETKAPRYQPLKIDLDTGSLTVDPSTSDRELELQLHKVLAEKERELVEKGQQLLVPVPDERRDEYKRRLAEYARAASELKKSDLAGYVFHRRTIIDLLASMIEIGPDGRFAREDELHNLIVPMGSETGTLMLDECNLWLIDERLAFHHYLGSDRPINQMPITHSESRLEPDVVALQVFDNPLLVGEGGTSAPATISIVEIKRPMRNNAAAGHKHDPIEQCYNYLNRIRKGGVTLRNGRPIPDAANVPAFCYVVCDITTTMIERMDHHDAVETADKMGYFFHNARLKCYVEVISFSRLVECAKQRNRAFFDKLGLPSA